MMQGIFTVLSLIAFIGVVVWAFSRHKKRDFDEAANIPFLDEDGDRVNEETGDKRNG